MLHRIVRSAVALVAATAALIGGIAPPASAQETSLPGAVSLDGDFYVLKQEGAHLRVWEWDNTSNTWVMPPSSLIPSTSVFGIGIDSRPAARTMTGGFHAVIKEKFNFNGGSKPRLIRWEAAAATPSGLVTTLKPDDTSTIMLTEPAGPIFDKRVFTVAGIANPNARSDHLLEADSRSRMWTNHGQESTGGRPSRHSPVSVLGPTQFFMAADNGHLVERWFTGSGWAWGDHGNPARRVDAVHVGAAMPSGKVFVTCDNGSLWQRWWSAAGGWQWHNHGIPYGWRVDSTAVAIADGKLFVTGDWDHNGGNTRVLLQLFYSGGIWQWHDHHTPPGTSIAEGGPAAAFGSHHIVVKGTNGRFYMCYWNWAAWVWKDCGSPP